MKSSSLVLSFLILLSTSCSFPPADEGDWPPPGSARRVDHRNYEVSLLTTAQIQEAAALKVYFEHASVGQDIVGNSNSDSSTGMDSSGSGPCGLALLYGKDSRFKINRSSLGAGAAWFDTHSGLLDNPRGNPEGEKKISGFSDSLTDELAGKVDVATYKFCWIDTPSDAQTLFETAKASLEALEAKYPGVTFVWWTMPIGCEAAPAQRQTYNNLVRDYCLSTNRWLLDIADLETHGSAGTPAKDDAGRELMQAEWAVSTGGDNHLNQAGKMRLAQAWWTLMVKIAEAR